MTNPLDELRNTTKSIQQKKEDNLNKTKNQRIEQQELLSKNSADHQQQVQNDAQAIAKKSKRIKVTILSILIVSLCAFFVFSLRLVTSGNYTISKKSELLADENTELDAKDDEYVPLKKFITSVVADFLQKPDVASIPWYSSLPIGRRERFFQTMKDFKWDDSVSVHAMRKDKKHERFFVDFENKEGCEITFDIVYNDDMVLKIVKIY